MTTSPTTLSLKYLRDKGYTAEVVEHWVPGANVRRDLFGWIDIVALKGSETLAVQTTTAPNVSARILKIAESATIDAVREAGWSVHVHGWTKVKNRWTLNREVDCS